MACEYRCCECGRDIVLITSDEPPPFRICGFCTFAPGWFRYPEIRAVLDPDHDGREAAEGPAP